jgi:outer membrane protein assembly factor BamB
MIAFGASDGNVYGLDANNGNIVWSFSTYGKPGSPKIYNQDLIFGTSKGRIYSLSPSPICSFDWPKPLDVVGNWPVEVEGRASSDAAIQKVEVRAAKGSWVQASGGEKWVATIDFSKVEAGAADVECRATDASGRMESNDYSTITIVKSDTAQPQKMYVFAPFEAMPQENFTLSVKDSRGVDLRNVNLTMQGEVKGGNSPFALTLGKSGDVAITVEKPGFETSRVLVRGKGGDSLMFALGGMLAIAAAAYFLVIRKMLAKKQ